jgi:hypothetical protein
LGEPNTKQIKQLVLIADDSSTVRKFVSFSLGAQGVEVITAVDGPMRCKSTYVIFGGPPENPFLIAQGERD